MKKPQELYNQIPRQTAPHHLYEQYYLGLSSKKGRVRVGERKSYQSLLYPITLPWYFPKKKSTNLTILKGKTLPNAFFPSSKSMLIVVELN